MKTGDHINITMDQLRAWLHAHHNVHNSAHEVDMYTFAGLEPVHTSNTYTEDFRESRVVTLEVKCPHKYLAAKLRYGI